MPECNDGDVIGIPFGSGGPDWVGGSPGQMTCIAGKWVVTKEPQDAVPPTGYEQDPETGQTVPIESTDATGDADVENVDAE